MHLNELLTNGGVKSNLFTKSFQLVIGHDLDIQHPTISIPINFNIITNIPILMLLSLLLLLLVLLMLLVLVMVMMMRMRMSLLLPLHHVELSHKRKKRTIFFSLFFVSVWVCFKVSAFNICMSFFEKEEKEGDAVVELSLVVFESREG